MRTRHSRHSIRLRGYDYSRAGAYFVTIVSHHRACLFGDVVDGEIALNEAGMIALHCWQEITEHFPHAQLDEFVIMPNHIHGIITIEHNVRAKNFSPLRGGTSKTIGSIVRGFKIGVTKWMRQNTDIYQVWHRNYYEHVVRDDEDLMRIRQYIANNPQNWDSDEENIGHSF